MSPKLSVINLNATSDMKPLGWAFVYHHYRRYGITPSYFIVSLLIDFPYSRIPWTRQTRERHRRHIASQGRAGKTYTEGSTNHQ